MINHIPSSIAVSALAMVVISGCSAGKTSRTAASMNVKPSNQETQLLFNAMSSRLGIEEDRISFHGIIPLNNNNISGIAWISTGGRVGKGMIASYNSQMEIVEAANVSSINDVRVVRLINTPAFLIVTEITASGAGLHNESVSIYTTDHLSSPFWTRVVRAIEMGPYPEAKRMITHVAIQQVDQDPSLCVIEIEEAGEQKQDGSIAWSDPQVSHIEYTIVCQRGRFQTWTLKRENTLVYPR